MNGPLFVFGDGRPLTRQRFVGSYAGHSFRIGAVTTAAARGLEDSTIQTLDRWKSLAYLEYIRIPRQAIQRGCADVVTDPPQTG